MIELDGLTKRFGNKVAVDHLSCRVRPGMVTGFLGPNGAGKSTTMRMMLDLDNPTSGSVRIDGRHYRDLQEPLKHIGALLDAKSMHGGRSAYNNLLCLAQSNRIPTSRVSQVLDTVGLTAVAKKKSKGFSSAWASGWGSRRRCWATPRSSCSTSPSTAWTPRASTGSGI